VLRTYLEAWLPIMGRWNGRILFIDGFAGPGEYRDGEDGSPIIAIQALADHRAKAQIAAEVSFMFIEQEPARAAHLDRLVQAMRPALPPHCEAQVITGAFDETMEGC
jgi:three-Cys-motif partner protein